MEIGGSGTKPIKNKGSKKCIFVLANLQIY
jgi:hypothetical protein